jgi:hypothetical protein
MSQLGRPCNRGMNIKINITEICYEDMKRLRLDYFNVLPLLDLYHEVPKPMSM